MPAASQAIAPFTMGIDSGSLTAKAVVMDGNRNMLSHSVVQMGFVSQEAVRAAMDNALSAANLQLADMACTVGTGYGRRRLDFADRAVTEISCHAKGANFLFPQARTVIDIGGQDSKVIAVENGGNASNFAMNDRCAAGTGQFLEVMAKALELDLEKTGPLSLQAKTCPKISSICTVFAETEVISLVAQGLGKADVLAAVHQAIAGRVSGMVARVGLCQPVMMTGGVAKNIGVVKALEKVMGVSLFVPVECQIVGAMGAALFAADYLATPD